MSAKWGAGGIVVQSRAQAAATSTLPPELSGTVPRNVRLTAGGIAMIVAAVMMATGALAVAIGMSVAYIRSGEARLRDGGSVAVEARVEDVFLRRGENPRRVVIYTYDVDGRTHTGRVVLRPRDRRAFAVGGSIPIRYVNSRPDQSWAIDYEPGTFPLWLIPLVSISLLAGGAGLVLRRTPAMDTALRGPRGAGPRHRSKEGPQRPPARLSRGLRIPGAQWLNAHGSLRYRK